MEQRMYHLCRNQKPEFQKFKVFLECPLDLNNSYFDSLDHSCLVCPKQSLPCMPLQLSAEFALFLSLARSISISISHTRQHLFFGRVFLHTRALMQPRVPSRFPLLTILWLTISTFNFRFCSDLSVNRGSVRAPAIGCVSEQTLSLDHLRPLFLYSSLQAHPHLQNY